MDITWVSHGYHVGITWLSVSTTKGQIYHYNMLCIGRSYTTYHMEKGKNVTWISHGYHLDITCVSHGYLYQQLKGKDITMACFASGDPTPQITWRKVRISHGYHMGVTWVSHRYMLGATNVSIQYRVDMNTDSDLTP